MSIPEHPSWVALIRGINVGGHRKLPMAELRALCTELGWRNVQTYIQSGNIVFQVQGDPVTIKSALEEAIKNRFNENRKRVDQLCQKLRLFPTVNRTGPFYWAKLPGRKQSRRFCRQLYLRCGILVVPGIAFGIRRRPLRILMH